MSKPFDATTKELMERDPAAWLVYLGLAPGGPVQLVDSDLSTVSASADKVFRIDAERPHIVHVELQASADGNLPRRLWRYNAMLDLGHDLRVQSIAVLLRPEADGPSLTGLLDLHLPAGRPVVQFHYDVVRAWRQPVEPILTGALGVLPMAPLADLPRARVPEVLRQIDERLLQEAQPSPAAKIMESALILAGMRLEEDEIEDLRGRLRTVNITTESSYYRLAVREGREAGLQEGLQEGLQQGLQQGLQEGRITEARRLILRIGGHRFGPPSQETLAAIEAICDPDRLERLGDRLLAASSWAELLAEPQD